MAGKNRQDPIPFPPYSPCLFLKTEIDIEIGIETETLCFLKLNFNLDLDLDLCLIYADTKSELLNMYKQTTRSIYSVL